MYPVTEEEFDRMNDKTVYCNMCYEKPSVNSEGRCNDCEEILEDVWDMKRVEEIALLTRIIKRVQKINPPKFKHLCHEWDGLEINEFDPEFDTCTCYGEQKPWDK